MLDKLGVADRHEAVAKVYADHYAPALEERQGLTAEGWFDGIPHPLPVDDEGRGRRASAEGAAGANGSGAPS